MCEFCQMTWTLQNLISSQKYLILDLQKGQIKSVSTEENFKWENNFIGIMFLHTFDILNRNLNGLFQKFMPVLTKLCAVTKLGDLTVPRTYGSCSFRQWSSRCKQKLIFSNRFCLLLFEGKFTSFFKNKKHSQKRVEIKVFLTFFLVVNTVPHCYKNPDLHY